MANGEPAGRVDRTVEAAFRRVAPLLSRVGGRRRWSDADLAGFTRAQRLAYEVAIEVHGGLTPGVTEREAAGRLATACSTRGVRHFLHRPFAWFGPHSRFDPEPGAYGQYHPTDMQLGENVPFILDISPVVDGYTADIGYSACLTPNPALEAARTFLRQLRKDLPGWFTAARDPGEVWDRAAQAMRDAGYTPTHADYPFRVLGHRLFKLTRAETAVLPGVKLPGGPMGSDWFSPQAAARFGAGGLASGLITSEHRGSKLGVWAIEPHLGADGFGAKFEEILVVTPDGARWLDEQVPHA